MAASAYPQPLADPVWVKAVDLASDGSNSQGFWLANETGGAENFVGNGSTNGSNSNVGFWQESAWRYYLTPTGYPMSDYQPCYGGSLATQNPTTNTLMTLSKTFATNVGEPNSTSLTIQRNGVYYVRLGARAVNSTNGFYLAIRRNGTWIVTGYSPGGREMIYRCHTVLFCGAGDTIDVYHQTGGGTTNITGSASGYGTFYLVKVA